MHPDLAALLGGGAPASVGPSGGGMPPGLAALAGGAPPPSIQLPSGGNDEGRSPEEILRDMIADAHAYIKAEKDPEDRATMSKVLQTLLQYQADEQKQRDAALGTSPAVKHLRSVSGG